MSKPFFVGSWDKHPDERLNIGFDFQEALASGEVLTGVVPTVTITPTGGTGDLEQPVTVSVNTTVFSNKDGSKEIPVGKGAIVVLTGGRDNKVYDIKVQATNASTSETPVAHGRVNVTSE